MQNKIEIIKIKFKKCINYIDLKYYFFLKPRLSRASSQIQANLKYIIYLKLNKVTPKLYMTLFLTLNKYFKKHLQSVNQFFILTFLTLAIFN